MNLGKSLENGCNCLFRRGGGGGASLYCRRLIGICCKMGSHFHDWIDYNGVTHFPIFGGKTVLHIYGHRKRTRMFVLQMKSKVFLIQ